MSSFRLGQHYKKGKKVEKHQSYALTINQLSVLFKKKKKEKMILPAEKLLRFLQCFKWK